MGYQLEARSREEQLFRYLALENTDIVADVGCGTGYFTGLMQDTAAYVIGVDIDLRALKLAKTLSAAPDFILSDVNRLPIKDQAVTKVLCTEVLEHVLDDAGLATECFRVLRENGVLVCSSPNASFPFRSKKSSHREKGPEFHFRVGYSPESFGELLSHAGFASVGLSYALPVLGTLLVEVLERTYSTMYNPLKSQSELMRLSDGRIFKLYRFLFPFLLLVVKMDFPKSRGGSILIVKASRARSNVQHGA